MNTLTTFDSTKESLLDLLRSIRDGRTQLPDFQRGWVWDDQHIRSLLASITLSYPVGAVMLLQTGNPSVRFKPRLVEGVSIPNGSEPERLILDGQQRLTSLYQALYSRTSVATRDARGAPLQRWYYVDLKSALAPNGDIEDAIIGVPEDRVVRNFRGEVLRDLSTVERECAEEFMPLRIVFDTSALTDWQLKYISADPAAMPERLIRWNRVVTELVQPFQQYQVPLIFLRKETPKEAVCQVFEKVNTGGVSLTVFELLTAGYAADDYNLRGDWNERSALLKKSKVLSGVENTDLLQSITLLATRANRQESIARGNKPEAAPGISCKRRDVLRLGLSEYKTSANAATKGFDHAARLLFAQMLAIA